MRLQGLYVAASLGFEPRQRDSESLVLPLHYEAKAWEAKAKFALEKSESNFAIQRKSENDE